MITNDLYTASRLKVLRSCLRLHYYRYKLGIASPSSDEARFGTVAHAALEAYLLAWKAGDHRLRAAFVTVNASDLSPFDCVRLMALLVAYDARWGAEDWEILEVEVEFRYELGDALIGGKIDAIIRDRKSGLVYVLEHKTTGQDASPGSPYWERLAIDTQISIYVDGATMLGYEIAGVIYDVLQRPRHEQKLATPKEKREYTQGKGCKICGGNLQGKQGIGKVGDADCNVCRGSGWRIGEDGQPEGPRLYAKQRDIDETPTEFGQRLAEDIGKSPDDFLIRGTIVRLEGELPAMRIDLIETIKIGRAAELFDLHPRNPDACAKYGAMCSFFAACSGRESIDNPHLFPRGAAHPELATAA